MLDKNALIELLADMEGTDVEIVPIPFPRLDQEIDRYVEMQGQLNTSEVGVYYGEPLFANDRWYNRTDVIFQVRPPVLYELERKVGSWQELYQDFPGVMLWTTVAHEVIDNRSAVIMRSDNTGEPLYVATGAMSQALIGIVRKVKPV